ncbi:hypothetical protein [Nocardioides sp.]|nr:hypothetical protein [Nocardioides sp.]
MAIGILGLLVGIVLAVVGLTVLYFVIRYAVRDGFRVVCLRTRYSAV